MKFIIVITITISTLLSSCRDFVPLENRKIISENRLEDYYKKQKIKKTVKNIDKQSKINTKKKEKDVENPENSSVNEIVKEKLQDILPYGKKIPNKNGLVYSPFINEGNKIVDVRGLSPGTIVFCPYTNKKFRVP